MNPNQGQYPQYYPQYHQGSSQNNQNQPAQQQNYYQYAQKQQPQQTQSYPQINQYPPQQVPMNQNQNQIQTTTPQQMYSQTYNRNQQMNEIAPQYDRMQAAQIPRNQGQNQEIGNQKVMSQMQQQKPLNTQAQQITKQPNINHQIQGQNPTNQGQKQIQQTQHQQLQQNSQIPQNVQNLQINQPQNNQSLQQITQNPFQPNISDKQAPIKNQITQSTKPQQQHVVQGLQQNPQKQQQPYQGQINQQINKQPQLQQNPNISQNPSQMQGVSSSMGIKQNVQSKQPIVQNQQFQRQQIPQQGQTPISLQNTQNMSQMQQIPPQNKLNQQDPANYQQQSGNIQQQKQNQIQQPPQKQLQQQQKQNIGQQQQQLQQKTMIQQKSLEPQLAGNQPQQILQSQQLPQQKLVGQYQQPNIQQQKMVQQQKQPLTQQQQLNQQQSIQQQPNQQQFQVPIQQKKQTPLKQEQGQLIKPQQQQQQTFNHNQQIPNHQSQITSQTSQLDNRQFQQKQPLQQKQQQPAVLLQKQQDQGENMFEYNQQKNQQYQQRQENQQQQKIIKGQYFDIKQFDSVLDNRTVPQVFSLTQDKVNEINESLPPGFQLDMFYIQNLRFNPKIYGESANDFGEEPKKKLKTEENSFLQFNLSQIPQNKPMKRELLQLMNIKPAAITTPLKKQPVISNQTSQLKSMASQNSTPQKSQNDLSASKSQQSLQQSQLQKPTENNLVGKSQLPIQQQNISGQIGNNPQQQSQQIRQTPQLDNKLKIEQQTQKQPAQGQQGQKPPIQQVQKQIIPESKQPANTPQVPNALLQTQTFNIEQQGWQTTVSQTPSSGQLFKPQQENQQQKQPQNVNQQNAQPKLSQQVKPVVQQQKPDQNKPINPTINQQNQNLGQPQKAPQVQGQQLNTNIQQQGNQQQIKLPNQDHNQQTTSSQPQTVTGVVSKPNLQNPLVQNNRIPQQNQNSQISKQNQLTTPQLQQQNTQTEDKSNNPLKIALPLTQSKDQQSLLNSSLPAQQSNQQPIRQISQQSQPTSQQNQISSTSGNIINKVGQTNEYQPIKPQNQLNEQNNTQNTNQQQLIEKNGGGISIKLQTPLSVSQQANNQNQVDQVSSSEIPRINSQQNTDPNSQIKKENIQHEIIEEILDLQSTQKQPQQKVSSQQTIISQENQKEQPKNQNTVSIPKKVDLPPIMKNTDQPQTQNTVKQISAPIMSLLPPMLRQQQDQNKQIQINNANNNQIEQTKQDKKISEAAPSNINEEQQKKEIKMEIEDQTSKHINTQIPQSLQINQKDTSEASKKQDIQVKQEVGKEIPLSSGQSRPKSIDFPRPSQPNSQLLNQILNVSSQPNLQEPIVKTEDTKISIKLPDIKSSEGQQSSNQIIIKMPIKKEEEQQKVEDSSAMEIEQSIDYNNPEPFQSNIEEEGICKNEMQQLKNKMNQETPFFQTKVEQSGEIQNIKIEQFQEQSQSQQQIQSPKSINQNEQAQKRSRENSLILNLPNFENNPSQTKIEGDSNVITIPMPTLMQQPSVIQEVNKIGGDFKKKKMEKKNITQEDQKIMTDIMGRLLKNKNSDPFKKLSSLAKNPDYLRVVKEPMDLSTVENNIKKKYYSNIDEMAIDVSKIFENAKLYNKEDTDIYKKAVELEEYFKKKYQKSPLSNEINNLQKKVDKLGKELKEFHTYGGRFFYRENKKVQKQAFMERSMTLEEKTQLAKNIRKLPKEYWIGIWEIMTDKQFAIADKQRVEFDLETTTPKQCRRLERYVKTKLATIQKAREKRHKKLEKQQNKPPSEYTDQAKIDKLDTDSSCITDSDDSMKDPDEDGSEI